MPHDRAGPEELVRFLDASREALAGYLAREAGGVRGRESVQDLVHGVHSTALQQARDFEWRSEAEAFAWLKLPARQHLLDRRKHWSARRRALQRFRKAVDNLSRSPRGDPHDVS